MIRNVTFLSKRNVLLSFLILLAVGLRFWRDKPHRAMRRQELAASAHLPSPRVDVGGRAEKPDVRARRTDSASGGERDTDGRSSTLRHNGTKSVSDGRQLILFWTPKLGVDDWTWGLGSEPFSSCEYSNCEFSTDKHRLDEATMLLFYCREEPHFPDRRHARQLYAHFSREPPHQVHDDYAKYSDAINMSISYRRDGNIHVPYFELVPYEDGREPYVPRIDFSEKTRNVVWMASNCRPVSKRDVYVRELSKYIDVDVYGGCGNYSCRLGEHGNIYAGCFEHFELKYKFYLAFENAICRDYFTEKLNNPLQFELVPIVLGGADYEKELPRRSYINVADFGSPKQLAGYLRNMTSEEYYGYFAWKSDYFTRSPPVQCKLCEFLHNSPYARGETIRPPYTHNYTAWMYDSCDDEWMDRAMKNW